MIRQRGLHPAAPMAASPVSKALPAQSILQRLLTDQESWPHLTAVLAAIRGEKDGQLPLPYCN
jgi:hypothetical protein